MRRPDDGRTGALIATPRYGAWIGAAAAIAGAGVLLAASVETDCAGVEQIDAARIVTPAGRLDRQAAVAAALHSRLQPETTSPYEVDAEIRISERGWSMPGGTSLVAQRVEGRWSLSAKTEGEATPRLVALQLRDTHRIDRMLHGRCLYRTPRYLPNDLPLKGGQRQICDDGVDRFIEVRNLSLKWSGFQACQGSGAPGRIADALSRLAHRSRS